MDIYQAIWNADQDGNGVQPVLDASKGDPDKGYVVVNEQPSSDRKLKLFTEVKIPEAKRESYELCTRLFNNYYLSPKIPELQTPEEDQEVEKLLEFIVDSKPMVVAREYMEKQTGESFHPSRWYKILMDIWFTRFTQSSGMDLSGFEHVVVGEQSGGKVSGYHFWYKYYLDDSFHLLGSDDIEYLGLKGMNTEENMLVPEVSTLSFKWEAFDYRSRDYRPLYKKIGGFFNGCSIEGLMALGTIRFLGMGRAPKEAEINGSLYNMKVYRSGSGKHMRTFYPVFVRQMTDHSEGITPQPPVIIVGSPGGVSPHPAVKDIKIVAALVNPEGHDPGLETITLLNISPKRVDLNGWKLMDKNNHALSLNLLIEPGDTIRIRLAGSDSPQLSNKGGTIVLNDHEGQMVDQVHYTREQARKQGWSVVF